MKNNRNEKQHALPSLFEKKRKAKKKKNRRKRKKKPVGMAQWNAKGKINTRGKEILERGSCKNFSPPGNARRRGKCRRVVGLWKTERILLLRTLIPTELCGPTRRTSAVFWIEEIFFFSAFYVLGFFSLRKI